MELAGLVVTNPAILQANQFVQLELCWGGKKKASKLSGLELPSPSLKFVVRHRDTHHLSGGPLVLTKGSFARALVPETWVFFPLQDFGFLMMAWIITWLMNGAK
jgi:hypothetical protein